MDKPQAAKQYRPTASDWQPYHAELQRYPWWHPTHWLYLTLQQQEWELLACERDPMRGRPDIYDRIQAEEKARGVSLLFPSVPNTRPIVEPLAALAGGPGAVVEDAPPAAAAGGQAAVVVEADVEDQQVAVKRLGHVGVGADALLPSTERLGRTDNTMGGVV